MQTVQHLYAHFTCNQSMNKTNSRISSFAREKVDSPGRRLSPARGCFRGFLLLLSLFTLLLMCSAQISSVHILNIVSDAFLKTCVRSVYMPQRTKSRDSNRYLRIMFTAAIFTVDKARNNAGVRRQVSGQGKVVYAVVDCYSA